MINRFIKTAAFLAALSVSVLAGCNTKPEGVYKLDKEAAKKAAMKNAAGQSAADKELGQALAGTIDMVDGTLEIKEGGKFERKTTAPTFVEKGEKRETTESGDWKMDGDIIILEAPSGTTKCTRDGSRLECKGEKDGDISMYVKS